MPHQIIDIIYLPFVTGFVGYLTNKLAIKMLFRPYEPKWYTFGWQGIVPRTRPALADKIGIVVGQKLLRHEDLVSVVSGSDFKVFLQVTVSSKLSSITKDDILNFTSNFDIEEIILNNSTEIDAIGNNIISKILDTPASLFINEKTINKKIGDITPSLSKIAASEIIGAINNFICSGKSLEDTLPQSIVDKTDKIAEHLTYSAVEIIKASGRSVAVKEVAAEKIVEFKNSFFAGGGADMLKLGLLNMFLDDETIANTVKRELPTILESIADNSSVRLNINNNIKSEINKLLRLKLTELADKAGADTIPSINAKIKTYFSSEDINLKIHSLLFNNVSKLVGDFSTLSCGAVLENIGININQKNLMPKLSSFLLSFEKHQYAEKIAEIIALYLQTNHHKISIPVTEKIISVLKTNMELILQSVNIEKTVENKINGLPLKDVEDLLFSFMRTHFKWINILGFVIGFVIGIIQLVITRVI